MQYAQTSIVVAAVVGVGVSVGVVDCRLLSIGCWVAVVEFCFIILNYITFRYCITLSTHMYELPGKSK